MRRAATWISQPRGLSGTPSAGHCTAAAISASWTASSAAEKSPKRRTTAPSTCGARSRSRFSLTINATSHVHGRRAHHLAHLDGHVQRHAALARRRRRAGGDLVGLLRALDIDDPVAREKLLGLRRTGRRSPPARRPSARAPPGLFRPGQPFGAHQHADSVSSLLNRIMNPMWALMSSGGQVPMPAFPSRARGMHHQHVFHRSPSPCTIRPASSWTNAWAWQAP